MKELKTKKIWGKVGEETGVNKSLVVKWNKDRDRILVERVINKQKKN